MRNHRRLLLSWIIAIGLIGFGVLANWYLVFVWAAQPVETPNPYQQLYEDLLYPSVRIETADGCGSGVILSNEQLAMSKEQVTQNVQCSLLNAHYIYVLTAAHVVGNEALVTVELFNSTESLPAFVVVTDTGKDLALLAISRSLLAHSQKPTAHSIYTAKLAPRDYIPKIFTPVWVIGCSLGLPPRPSEGIITAVNQSTCQPVDQSTGRLENRQTGRPSYWEISAPIWPGNSGGGVFLKDTHELIGIAVWVRVYHVPNDAAHDGNSSGSRSGSTWASSFGRQLVSTMAGVVPLQEIYNFLEGMNIEH